MAAETGFVAPAPRRADRCCCWIPDFDAVRLAAVVPWLRFVAEAAFEADFAEPRFADEVAFEADRAELRFAVAVAFEAAFAGLRLADEAALEADFAEPRFADELPFEADFAEPRFADEVPFAADFAGLRFADFAVDFADEVPFESVFLDAVVVSSDARRRALPAVRDFDVVLFGDLAISNSLRLYSYDHRLLRASADEHQDSRT
jgi:hypothetical protein